MRPCSARLGFGMALLCYTGNLLEGVVGVFSDLWRFLNPTQALIEGAADAALASDETPQETQTRRDQARERVDRVEQTVTAPLTGAAENLSASALNPWSWVGLGPGQTTSERLVGIGRLFAVGALVAAPLVGVGYLGWRVAQSTQQAALALAPLAIQNAGGVAQLVKAAR